MFICNLFFDRPNDLALAAVASNNVITLNKVGFWVCSLKISAIDSDHHVVSPWMQFVIVFIHLNPRTVMCLIQRRKLKQQLQMGLNTNWLKLNSEPWHLTDASCSSTQIRWLQLNFDYLDLDINKIKYITGNLQWHLHKVAIRPLIPDRLGI